MDQQKNKKLGFVAVRLAIKNQATEKLRKLTRRSSEYLFSAKTVFPFDVVPDIVRLDRNQLTLEHRELFQYKKIDSIQIKDILNAEMTATPFLATLKVNSRFFTDQHITIHKMKIKDAMLLRRLIQGLVIINAEKINIKEIEKEELVRRLLKLGSNAR